MKDTLQLALTFLGATVVGLAVALAVRAAVGGEGDDPVDHSRHAAKSRSDPHAGHDMGAGGKQEKDDTDEHAGHDMSPKKDDPAAPFVAAGLHDVKNPVCPVMDAPVRPESPALFLYNGLIVRFCCPGCDIEFTNDPAGYLTKMKGDGGSVPAKLLEKSAHPEVVEAENKNCPISGSEIGSGGMEPVRVVHKGVGMKLCCASCLERYAVNPDAALREAAKSGTVPADRL